jgi:hypothetical protein
VRHYWTVLGTARTGTTEERALRLAFEEQDWPTATNLRTGNAREDFLEIAILKCGDTQRLSALQILSYFDLWMDDEVLAVTVLSSEGSLALDSMIPADSWRAINDLGPR